MLPGILSEDFDAAPCGYIKMSEATVITVANKTFFNLIGTDDPDSVIGRSFEKLLTIAGRIFFQTHFFPILKLHGEAREIFFNLRKHEGGELPVICNAVSKTENGAQVFLCIFFPVTARGKYEQGLLNAKRESDKAREENADFIKAKQELEEKISVMDRQRARLLQLNADITQFSKIISHDLQESIRKIALFTEKLSFSEQDSGYASNISGLKKINSACLNLRELTIKLEKFISLEIGTEELKPVRLSDVINAAGSKARLSNNVTVTIEAETDFLIPGYEDQLELLFFELLKKISTLKDNEGLMQVRLTASVVKRNSLRSTENIFLYTDHVQIDFYAHSDKMHRPEIINEFNNTANLISFKSLEFALCKKIADNHHGLMELVTKGNKGRVVRLIFPCNKINEE